MKTPEKSQALLKQYECSLRSSNDHYYWAVKETLKQRPDAYRYIDERIYDLLEDVMDPLKLIHMDVNQDLKDRASALLADLANTPHEHQKYLLNSLLLQMNHPAHILGSCSVMPWLTEIKL